MTRTGIGYDIHRLEAGRPMVLGGVVIPSDSGPVGHSDADVLLHAVIDALLGAGTLGDIGTWFPDTDPKWKGADSRVMLRDVHAKLRTHGFKPVHVDATVVLERPRLRPHIDAMRAAIADDLLLRMDQVSVKATTHEGLGPVGQRTAVAAWAVCTVKDT